MRITNKIMQNNSLNNVNYNKVLKDALNTQMSTQKKISRPSDDPVVAIRALRLRSNVSEVTQYYSKNIPDAESWLSVTEGALDNVANIITDMYKQCVKGSSGEITSEDRKTVLESLKSLREEVYATGDADYAGRYVFTGYRTDTSLMFPSGEQKTYSITEQLDKTAADTITYIKTNKYVSAAENHELTDLNATNYEDLKLAEQDIEAIEVHRIRLAYSGLDYPQAGGTLPALTHVEGDGTLSKFKDTDGNDIDTAAANSYDVPSPYEQAAKDPDAVIFVADTGELLLGSKVYEQVMATKDNPVTNNVNEGEIRVTYEKSTWEKGDLRPEHYFACTQNPGDAAAINYNADYLTTTQGSTQIIEYDVGFNQTIRVNSTADECFKHGVGREVDDLISTMEETIEMEGIVGKLEELLKANEGTSNAAAIQEKLDAANKAFTLLKNKTQKLFESGMSTMQGYLDDANLAVTNNGNRGKKLSLIESRMQSQKTTFETLQSENEDVDIADVTIQLTSAEMTYEASLLATSKVMKTTLLDFI